MWPSIEIAERIYNWANTGFIASLVIGVICTFLVVWMGNIKEAHLKNNVAIANEHAAEANATAESEKLERAKLEANLKRDIANADARAAEANAKAEKEKLERVKLETRLAPRNLTQEQQYAIQKKLIPLGWHRVYLAVNPSNTETERFVRMLGPVIPPDWEKIWADHGPVMPLYGGVVVLYGYKEDEEAANVVSEAINAEGFKAFIELISPDQLISMKPKVLWIVVGQKF